MYPGLQLFVTKAETCVSKLPCAGLWRNSVIQMVSRKDAGTWGCSRRWLETQKKSRLVLVCPLLAGKFELLHVCPGHSILPWPVLLYNPSNFKTHLVFLPAKMKGKYPHQTSSLLLYTLCFHCVWRCQWISISIVFSIEHFQNFYLLLFSYVWFHLGFFFLPCSQVSRIKVLKGLKYCTCSKFLDIWFLTLLAQLESPVSLQCPRIRTYWNKR